MGDSRVFDVVIVGGGPGGYPTAVRASQHGLSVALIERHKLGGECTNYGCVPTKALLRAAKLARDLVRYAWARGSVDGASVLEWARSVADGVRLGVGRLLEHYGVTVISDEATGVDGNCVITRGGRYCGRRGVIIATGSEPRRLSNIPFDGVNVIDNRGLISLEKPPESILIVGAGYVGVEFSYALASLGSNVHLVEIMDRPLPALPREASLQALRALRSLGVRVFLSHKVVNAELNKGKVVVTLEGRKGREIVEVEKVLIAVGRTPNSNLKGLRESGVKIDTRGFIETDCHMRTGNPMIYATGDVRGPPLLAHKAFVEALIAADNIAGYDACLKDFVIPEVVYIRPEIVRVYRPTNCESASVRVRVDALARARIEGEGGLVKLTYEKSTGRIVELLMIFEGASEVAGEAAALVANGLTIYEAAKIVHPHPTMSEALWEALHIASGSPVHLVDVRRRAQ
ncbi:MAG: NAD(P)/FAD-dependent oxidoreductase [Desulfurococcales archaeon]|nr:NAD(P)/FAD-dependent oxidoreductase [Desulfurococcales archaeon]